MAKLFRTRRRSRRSGKSWWLLVVALVGLSVYQYRQDGEITWHEEILADLRSQLPTSLEDLLPLPDSSGPSSSDEGTGERIAGRVASVADGDTLTLELANGEKVRIRLFGIDAPERDQPYGKESGQALRSMVEGKRIEVLRRDVDQYGRTVGTAFKDGQDVNLTQVSTGMAWWYEEYAKRDQELKSAEQAAKRAKIGLWRDKSPVAPWDWRRQQRTGQ